MAATRTKQKPTNKGAKPKVTPSKVWAKRGRLSADEKRQIEGLCEIKSDEEIAEILRRPVESVKLYRLEYLTDNPHITAKKNEHTQLRNDLRTHYQWETFQKQFSPDELIIFENSYVEIVSQFQDQGIKATEQKQIFQAITLEIFMIRHNEERQSTINDIKRLEKMINALFEAKSPEEMTDDERKTVVTLEANVSALRQSSQSKTREYKDLSDRYGEILKQLKSTREQRITKVDNNNIKFTDVLRDLEQEELRNRIGGDMLVMNKAVEIEKERLSQLHTFMDGSVSQPLMTPENVMKLEG